MPVDVLFSVRAQGGRPNVPKGSLVSAMNWVRVEFLVMHPLGRKGSKELGWIRVPDVPDSVAQTYGQGGLNEVETPLVFPGEKYARRFGLHEGRLRSTTARAPGMVDRALDPTRETPVDDMPTLTWDQFLPCLWDNDLRRAPTQAEIEAYTAPGGV